MNIQGCFPLGLTGLIPLQSQGPSRVVSNKHHNSKASILYLASSTDFNYKYCQWFLTLFFIFDHWSRFITVTHRWKLKQAFWKMEKDMTTHSSVLAWRIPGTADPAGLLSVGLHRVGHDWSGLAAAAARQAWLLPHIIQKTKLRFREVTSLVWVIFILWDNTELGF